MLRIQSPPYSCDSNRNDIDKAGCTNANTKEFSFLDHQSRSGLVVATHLAFAADSPKTQRLLVIRLKLGGNSEVWRSLKLNGGDVIAALGSGKVIRWWRDIARKVCSQSEHALLKG
jgi:hypothetical protein